ncbi:MAG: ribokinase [Rhodospirillaceae bacterium]|nr:ribokinase [Rhodospirillaceae bacterium]
MAARPITVMGVFVADLAFRTPRLPGWGETVMGESFRIGPGGKGSNQAVAAARLGGTVAFVGKLGRDPFGDLARATYAAEGIDTHFVFDSDGEPTGGAAILVEAARAENAIVVHPGAGAALTADEVERARPLIARSAVFMTNLELPVPVVMHGLRMARELGVTTVLNPAPAVPVPEGIFALCDHLVPNEAEATALSGLKFDTLEEAGRAAEALRARGSGGVVLTLGGRGALVAGPQGLHHVPAIKAGSVVDTTGAGDAFCGGFAIALAEGADAVAATRFGCAVAGLAVTRWGTAPAMPRRAEVDALLARPG